MGDGGVVGSAATGEGADLVILLSYPRRQRMAILVSTSK